MLSNSFNSESIYFKKVNIISILIVTNFHDNCYILRILFIPFIILQLSAMHREQFK